MNDLQKVIDTFTVEEKAQFCEFLALMSQADPTTRKTVLSILEKSEAKKNAVDLLLELGISTAHRGFIYILEALDIIDDRGGDLPDSFFREVYAPIGARRGIKPQRVERCISAAVESGWGRGRQETQENIFGYSVSARTFKPTNTEFLSRVYLYIRKGI